MKGLAMTDILMRTGRKTTVQVTPNGKIVVYCRYRQDDNKLIVCYLNDKEYWDVYIVPGENFDFDSEIKDYNYAIQIGHNMPAVKIKEVVLNNI